MDEERIELKDAVPLRAPLVVHLELSNKCNFACRMCPESLSEYPELVGGFKSMSFTDYKNICSQLAELGGVNVLRLWIMGEPLLVKGIGAYIAHAKKSGAARRVEITSNGSALTADKGSEILKAGLDCIKISIYSPYQERNELITQKKFSVDKIYNNLINFFKTRNRLQAETRICVKLIEPFDVEEKNFFLEKYKSVSDETDIEQCHDWVGSEGGASPSALIHNIYGEKDFRPSAEVPRQKKVCPMPFYTAVIHADGTVGGCCVDWEKKNNFGNVFEDSLKSIWQGDKHNEFLNTHLRLKANTIEACKNCTYFIGATKDNIDELTTKNIEISAQSFI